MLTEEQRLKRRNGIGASDSPIIMGYSTYKTPLQLYFEKTGTITDDEEETELQYWGNALEPLILKRFSEENNVEVTFPDTVYHPDYPFIFANLDGFVPALNAVIEAKCANSFLRREWDLAAEDGIPRQYLIQIAKQVAIKNASCGYCAVLIGGFEYFQFKYERDRELENFIIESDKRFWENIQKRIEPDPINTDDCRLKYNSPHPDKIAQSNFRTSNALTQLMNTKIQRKQLEEREDHFKMQIMQHMGNAQYLCEQEGEIIATWKANKKGTRVFNIKGV
jgi:putative phage-type endonuclease